MPEAGKKLTELKVSDLKDELEKRKLGTVGAKATLLERLQNALKSQGIDPNTFTFTSNSKVNSPVVRKNSIASTGDIIVKEEPTEEEHFE